MEKSTNLTRLIERAHLGDVTALGELLQTYRPYLRRMARRFLGERLRVRVEESDLIQQTCLSAYRNFNQFTGNGRRSFLAWLSQIHERNIHDVLRDHLETEKRALDREERLESQNLAARSSLASPSQRAIRAENALQLAEALEELPSDQQQAIRLRYLVGCSLAEIAVHMERTEQAVAGLLKRGMRGLRKILPESEEEK